MTYLAYLCYIKGEPVQILFDKPNDWEFINVVPIQFSPLNRWKPND